MQVYDLYWPAKEREPEKETTVLSQQTGVIQQYDGADQKASFEGIIKKIAQALYQEKSRERIVLPPLEITASRSLTL